MASEALSGVRTVTAFGRQQLEIEKYAANLREAELAGRAKGVGTGLSMVRHACYALPVAWAVVMIPRTCAIVDDAPLT